MIVTEVDKYKRGWNRGRPETPCGFGSKINQTAIQRKWLPAMVAKYKIYSIADIGAGDLNWIKLIEWPHPIHYAAYDLVPRADGVKPFDLIHEIPPACDMVLCLWLLNHLPEDHAREAMKNLLAADCEYIVYTWWAGMYDFLDLGVLESAIIRTAYRQAGKMQYEIRLIKC
jgi:hypothetical protein